jgi:hypothetical protein
MNPFDASGRQEPAAVVPALPDALDQRFSRVARHAIKAQLHEAYANSWCTLLAFPEQCGEAVLVEGFLIIDFPERMIAVCEHGWLQRTNGSIIDPTLFVEPLPQETQLFYVAGVKRSRLEVALLLGTSRSFPVVRSDGRFGDDGMGHPQYRAAYHAARSHSVHRAHLSSPPKEVVLLLAQEPEIDLSGLVAEAKQSGEEHSPINDPTQEER